MNINEYIGKKVVEYRKAAKISQEQLAEYLGYTRTSVINIEKGRQGMPTGTLWLLCNALHCTPNDIFPSTRPTKYKYKEVDKVIYERVAKTVKVKKLIL